MKTFIALSALAFLTACGTKDTREATQGTDQSTNSKQIDTASLADDEEASSEAVTAQVDDAITSAAEDQDSSSGASLSLAEVDTKSEHNRYRNCTVEDGKAVVDIKRSLERSFSAEGPYRSTTSSLKALVEKQRTWSKENGEVACGENNKAAAIDWSDVDGLSVAVTFTHNRSREVSTTNKKKNITKSASFAYEASGTRAISWANATADSDDQIAVQKTVKSNVTRSLSITNKKGETKQFSGSVATDDASPLVTTVVRDKDSKAVISRTIESGKLIATNKDGGRVETTFAGVTYTKENRCMATAGKISGAIYEADATEPKVTFEINFNGDSKTIVYSNGNEVDYAPEGCVLDDPETVTEKTSKDDVPTVEVSADADTSADSSASDS